VGNPRCRGEAVLSRDAEDLGCACRVRSDAAWFDQVVPQRLGQFKLAVAPAKTRLLRFSRFHPGRKHRFPFWGVELFWTEDRQGAPRVQRRTARKKLQRACRRSKAWSQANRHLPGKAFFKGLKARLRGHYRYYGVHGTSQALSRFFDGAITCAFKWLHRRGGQRKRFSWKRYIQILDAVHRERPRITEGRRRGVVA
jgi:RNA-directed DNA polymerase